MIGIVCLHYPPFVNNEKYRLVWYFFDNIVRFSVPCFFVLAGYFFAKSYQRNNNMGALLKGKLPRLVRLFFFWSLIYGLISPGKLFHTITNSGMNAVPDVLWQGAVATVQFVIHEPMYFILNGSCYHLWFLPALLSALLLVALFVLAGKERYLLPLSFLLLVFAILSRSYAETPIGMDVPFDPRNGPFFSLFLVVFGWWFGHHEKKWPLLAIITILCGGTILHMTEVYLLWKHFQSVPIHHAFVAGTIPMGIGAFLVAFHFSRIQLPKIILSAGRATLGIYLAHVLMGSCITLLVQQMPYVLVQITLPILIYIATAAVVLFTQESKYTRWMTA